MIGFECYDRVLGTAYLDPAGNVVYMKCEGTQCQLRRLVQDSWRWDSKLESWVYPTDTSSNDGVLPTPGCKEFGRWVMQAETGEVMYQCDSTHIYMDSHGNEVAPDYRVLAWNVADTMLAESRSALQLILLDPARVEHPVSSDLNYGDLVDCRAHGDHFWAAVRKSGRLELWDIEPSGAASLIGPFPPPPEGRSRGLASKLDGDGVLFSIGEGPQAFQEIILRCEVGASVCEVVYDEAKATPNNLSGGLPQVYARLNHSHGPIFVTGP